MFPAKLCIKFPLNSPSDSTRQTGVTRTGFREHLKLEVFEVKTKGLLYHTLSRLTSLYVTLKSDQLNLIISDKIERYEVESLVAIIILSVFSLATQRLKVLKWF